MWVSFFFAGVTGGMSDKYVYILYQIVDFVYMEKIQKKNVGSDDGESFLHNII